MRNGTEVLPRLHWAVSAEAQLARVLGPAWQSMGYGTLTDRAQHLEQSAGFARKLAHYMVVTDIDTAGEALERLQASTVYQPGESFSV